MKSLPTGTVTFLFTDIEGSTELLQRLGDRRYAEVLEEHRRLLRDAFAQGDGQEIDTQGDAFLVAFSRARDAVGAAVAAQRALARQVWPDGASLRVRMGLHTGEPLSRDTDYVGIDVHRAARIAAAGHGGQILLSDVTHGLIARNLPDGVSLRDLGEHRLKDLAHQHRLFQVVAGELPADFPPIRSLDALPNNLPRQLTSFIGREKEMADIKRLLSTAYLVTLTGSGGAGKTRLALQVAADVVEDFPDGVWLSEFAPITDPVLVPKTIASAMNVPEQPGRDVTETLIDALRPKSLLLVFDNCEHILAACRDLAAALLRRCPQVRILATSREGLGVPGETLWRVPSLSLPDARRLPTPEDLVLYEAVRLFVDRALATAPGFGVTSANASAVAQVCQRLDGIPLAIELAAARVKVLAVEQIAARLNDRFRLLTGGSPVGLPRHQTLHNAIDWSYNLLSEPERVLLRRLSVFAGGWSLEAGESVCAGGSVEGADILDFLTSLVDKSLVLVETQRGEARYRFLETVRQYGLEKLEESGETEAVRRRHRDWYLDFAERAEPRTRGPEQEAWLKRLDTEHDNLRAALEWSNAQEGSKNELVRQVGALRNFWFWCGYLNEGRRWLEHVLPLANDAPTRLRINVLNDLAHLALMQDDHERSTRFSDESLTLSREAGDKSGTAEAFRILAMAAQHRGDHERAKALLTESLALSREINDRYAIALALNVLGEVARGQRDYDTAGAFYEESLVLRREVGTPTGIALTMTNLGRVALQRGDHGRATTLFTQALALAARLRFKHTIASCLAGLSGVAAARGRPERAARLSGAAENLWKALDESPEPVDRAEYDQHAAVVREALGDNAFTNAQTEGRAMTLEQAIEYAQATGTEQ